MGRIKAAAGTVAIVGLLALGLEPALADQPEDAWITTKVKMALLTDDQVDGLDVDVDTFDGRVTLHGKVATDVEKAQAEQRAREIEGVSEVRNLLAVVPAAASDEVEVEDEALAEQVSRALEQDDALAGSDIDVQSVNDGVVVLAGQAETLTAHRRAVENARGVEGVRRVASEIQSPDELGDEEIWEEETAGAQAAGREAGGAVSDAWLTTKAKVALMAEPGLSPMAINVDTRSGVVTLFGIVETEEIKGKAESEVSQLDGVKAVENELQVVPDVAADRTEAQDDELLEAVQERLGAREALSDADINLEVRNRVVRLTGTVASQRDRLTALTVARGTQGVDSVIDDLTLERES